jgi:metal-sulfur cluster biosynthetic enzyme
VALLSLLLNTARIKEPRAALVQTRRTGPTSGCPVKIEEPLTSGWCPFATHLLGEIEDALLARPDVDTCDVEVVWDEAWTTDRLSESAVGKLRFLPDPAAVPDRDAFVAALRPQTEEVDR